MKTINTLLFSILMIIPFATIEAQTTKNTAVFEQIKASFNQMYPNAEVKEWELEENNIYEVDFVYEGKKLEAEFAEDGTWIYTERNLEINELPANILNHFKNSDFASWKIEEAEELNTPQYDVLYELKLKKENNKMYLYYLPDGSLMESATKSKY